MFEAVELGALSVFVIQGLEAVNALKQIGISLDVIHEQLAIQNRLSAQGSSNVSGFASHVYQYLTMRIRETEKHRMNHYFFVFHPNTDWYPAFSDLVAKKSLPDNFYRQSDNLDCLAAWMKIIRQEERSLNDRLIFHILCPAYDYYLVPERLAFISVVFPLQIECLSNGGAYVALNLPGIAPTALKGIHNLADRPPALWARLLNSPWAYCVLENFHVSSALNFWF
jgi:hypothetical protein